MAEYARLAALTIDTISELAPPVAVGWWRRNCIKICVMQDQVTRNSGLAVLRAALIAERDRLARKAADTLQVLAAPENVAVEDQIPLLHEQFVALSRHSSDLRTFALINAAVDRFDRGEYGMCEECDAEISFKRLRVLPWASRCVRCQEQLECESTRQDGNVALSAYG